MAGSTVWKRTRSEVISRGARVALVCVCVLAPTAGCGGDDADPGARAEFQLHDTSYRVEVVDDRARILRRSPDDEGFEESSSSRLSDDPFLYAGRAEGALHAILVAPAGAVVDPPPGLVGELDVQPCGSNLCVGFLYEPPTDRDQEITYRLGDAEVSVPIPVLDDGDGALSVVQRD